MNKPDAAVVGLCLHAVSSLSEATRDILRWFELEGSLERPKAENY